MDNPLYHCDEHLYHCDACGHEERHPDPNALIVCPKCVDIVAGDCVGCFMTNPEQKARISLESTPHDER